ncbi:MAG: hypothetical protein WDZ88_04295 [Candidatus Paceibacterota bacterium]
MTKPLALSEDMFVPLVDWWFELKSPVAGTFRGKVTKYELLSPHQVNISWVEEGNSKIVTLTFSVWKEEVGKITFKTDMFGETGIFTKTLIA